MNYMVKKVEKEKDGMWKLYLLLASVFIIWIAYSFILPEIESNPEKRGVLGDSFGTINSLFSGLAFAGIIYTILLQRKELSLQRKELIETRKELSRSADAQEKLELQQKRQAENLKITAKLNALNSLLNYYSTMRNETHDVSEAINSIEERENCVQKIKEILKFKEN